MDKKEDDISLIPKRKISDIEKEYIDLKVEKLRLDREKATLVLNKGLYLFFAIFAMLLLGMVYNYFTKLVAAILLIIACAILIISILPYSTATKKEEKEIERLFETFLK